MTHATIPEVKAIQEVHRVMLWVWPHRHVIYPTNVYRPILDTPEQRKGRKMLERIEAYLAKQIRKHYES